MSTFEQYSGMTSASLEVVGVVLNAADVAYRSVAAELEVDPTTIHNSNYGEDVVRETVNQINAVEGFEAEERPLVVRGLPRAIGLVRHQGSEDVIMADPTWQELLPPGRDTEDLPRVLIGTPDEISDWAGRHGLAYFGNRAA